MREAERRALPEGGSACLPGREREATGIALPEGGSVTRRSGVVHAMPFAQRSTPTRPLHGKPRDALGRRAAEGVLDSQSASEGRESAKRERAA